MKYRKLWTDMHSNIHHENFSDLPRWYAHITQLMDFWPIAYYPFHMRKHPSGLDLEDVYEESVRNADWEKLREFTRNANAEGFPMFMGYEWQGSGKDGDHNVFFLHNDAPMLHPMRYEELRDAYKGQDVIGIPHHLAYQLGSRGKNWDTHDPAFSPFGEIYSSHGSSENDYGPIPMNRHVHMGPRTGETCFERGLERGIPIGIIASGDNHSVPGVAEHGSMCVLAEGSSKEEIWAAMLARRTYGVSQSRIDVDFAINGQPMGSILPVSEDKIDLALNIRGTDAIDRVEILRDNIPEATLVHSGSWERKPLGDTVRIKFDIQFGWGPDTRLYPDITSRHWVGSLETSGKLLSVEKVWNSFGQSLTNTSDQRCDFELTTYKSTATGKWMGPSNVVTEGFIFEVETRLDAPILLTVDGVEYSLMPRDLLHTSRLIPLYKEVEELTKERWGKVEHYRDDPWWHNCYKIKIGQAVPESAYTFHHEGTYPVEGDCQYRLRVWQRNGHIAWTSPIFLRKG